MVLPRYDRFNDDRVAVDKHALAVRPMTVRITALISASTSPPDGSEVIPHDDHAHRRRDLRLNEPTTTLDDRFSDPGALPTSWDDTVRTLKAAELFWITTVRPDGRPHVSPLVAVWLDGGLHFATGAAEQKAVNLRTNLILTTGGLAQERMAKEVRWALAVRGE